MRPCAPLQSQMRLPPVARHEQLCWSPSLEFVSEMAMPSAPVLDRTFAALADPTRRAILERLSDADRLTVSDLATPFAMSLPAVLKHVGVLTEAGLVAREKVGRVVYCRLETSPLRDALKWLALYDLLFSGRHQSVAVTAEPVVAKAAPAAKRAAPSRKQPPKGRGTEPRAKPAARKAAKAVPAAAKPRRSKAPAAASRRRTVKGARGGGRRR